MVSAHRPALVEPGPFPSRLLAAGKPPAHQDVLASFGELRDVPAARVAGLPICGQALRPPTPISGITAQRWIRTEQGARRATRDAVEPMK